MQGPARAVLDKGGCQGASHRADLFVPNASTSQLARGKMVPAIDSRPSGRSFWRLEPVHHLLTGTLEGLDLDCSDGLVDYGLLGWTRTDPGLPDLDLIS